MPRLTAPRISDQEAAVQARAQADEETRHFMTVSLEGTFHSKKILQPTKQYHDRTKPSPDPMDPEGAEEGPSASNNISHEQSSSMWFLRYKCAACHKPFLIADIQQHFGRIKPSSSKCKPGRFRILSSDGSFGPITMATFAQSAPIVVASTSSVPRC